MRMVKTAFVALLSSSVVIGCASQPIGPSITVMPAPDKPFEVFAAEQTACKTYAQSEISGQADLSRRGGAGAVLLTTALGAGLGAAVGGGDGAAIGAASGAVAGSALGSGNARRAGMSIQRRYDIAFEQRMYAKGNQVPHTNLRPADFPPPPANSAD